MAAAAQRRAKRQRGTALFYASLAVWIACFGLSSLYVLIGGLLDLSRGLAFPTGALSFVFVLAVFAAPVMLAITFIIGLPALLLLEHFKLGKFWHWAITGAVLGALLALCYAIASAVPFSDSVVVAIAELMALGAVAASAAWASLWLDRHGSVKGLEAQAE